MVYHAARMGDRPVRIQPLSPSEWSEAVRAELGGLVGVGGNPRPVHLPAVIARHPTFLAPYLGWAKAVALRGVLSGRHNELIALRTAYLCRSEFEWGVHAEYARRPGCLGDDEVAAVADGPDADRWSPTERALLEAADELHHRSVVSDATWAALARDFDPAALLEIVFVAGHTTMLSMVTSSSGVQPEATWQPLPP
jgi:alkylhydroperoxidase family enzyme